MLPLRIFLLIKDANGEWSVSVHRDLESTITTWTKTPPASEKTGLIHVGFTRSDTTLFEDLSIRFSGKMLLTAPARYVFASIGLCAPKIAGTVDGVPVYVALSGWGYEASAEELTPTSDLPTEWQGRKNVLSQPALDPSGEWLNMLVKTFPQDTEMVRVAGITDDKSYLELESKLEERLRIKVGRTRFTSLLKKINYRSPEEVLSIAPTWILNTPIDHIGLSVRSYHYLNLKGIKSIRELAYYTDSQLMQMRNMGRKSVIDIATAIINVIDKMPNPKPVDLVNPSGEWLNMLVKTFPQDAEMVRVAGITDDKSYLELESKLEEKLRTKIGRHRFHYLLDNINHISLKGVVGIAPPWILSTPIDHIDLSVRSRNCLKNKLIKTVGELDGYADWQLMRMKNFGRKSAINVARAIITAIGERPEALDLVNLQHKKGADALDQRQTKYLKHRIQPTESETFEDALLNLFKHLNQRDSMVMQQRMGFDTKSLTLEEIGGLAGVTRERVRQIEAKICNKEKSKPYWCQRVEEPIKKALKNRVTPLPVVALDIIDPWFANINKLEEPLLFVIKKFCSGELSVLKINWFSYLSAIDKEEWDSAVKEASGVLEQGVSHKWKQSEAKHAVEAILPKKAHEFCDELFIEASENAIFSLVEGSDEPILTGFGRGAEGYVEAVMVESDRPLHFTEIVDRIVAKGRKVEIGRAHNLALEIGLPYGRGTYGLMKHYPLDEEETQEMIAEVEDIIASGPKGRQWHCSELHEILCEHGLDMDGRLTQYVINIGLKRSKKLVDLKRLVWTAGRTATRMTAGNRIDIRQAIESLLRIEGGPLSYSDIRKRLLKEGRGIGEYFQIINEGNIIRIAKNYWGLVDRDIPFSIDQQKMIAEILEKTLYKTQKGIHKTEVHEVLKEMSGIVSFSTLDPAFFISIASRTGRMRYVGGNFLCMSDWSDARRPMPVEAVRIALEEAGSEGLLTKDLKNIASEKMGIDTFPETLYLYLSAVGARHNVDTKRWQIVTIEEYVDIS